MMTATIKNNINFPKLQFQSELKEIADRIIIPTMQKNMNHQVNIDQSPYPALKPETIAKKNKVIAKNIFTKKGKIRETASKKIEATGLSAFSNKTLFMTGKLFRSFISRNKGKTSVVITLMTDRKDIGGYLNPRFKFFGISKFMEKDAINYMRGIIKRKLDGR